MGEKQANWLVVAFFAVIIAVVFQQILTSMAEQGIASGSPYDNAAAYPRAVAILIGIMLLLQIGLTRFAARANAEPPAAADYSKLKKPVALLLIFAFFLAMLGVLGYHLSTTPMLMAVMFLCGLRQPVLLIVTSFSIATVLAFLFEHFLKIVLPGGVFGINIPW